MEEKEREREEGREKEREGRRQRGRKGGGGREGGREEDGDRLYYQCSPCSQWLKIMLPHLESSSDYWQGQQFQCVCALCIVMGINPVIIDVHTLGRYIHVYNLNHV